MTRRCTADAAVVTLGACPRAQCAPASPTSSDDFEVARVTAGCCSRDNLSHAGRLAQSTPGRARRRYRSTPEVIAWIAWLLGMKRGSPSGRVRCTVDTPAGRKSSPSILDGSRAPRPLMMPPPGGSIYGIELSGLNRPYSRYVHPVRPPQAAGQSRSHERISSSGTSQKPRRRHGQRRDGRSANQATPSSFFAVSEETEVRAAAQPGGQPVPLGAVESLRMTTGRSFAS